MSEEESSPIVGIVLDGRYRLITAGDHSDLGWAYKAYDMQQDRLVVLVVLDRHWGSDGEALRRLLETQQAMANLAAPGLVGYEHAGLVDGYLYVVAAPPEGHSLADLLAQTGRLEIGTAVGIAIQLCEVLAPAHREGMVHGGLSPQSVLLTKAGDSGESVGQTVTLLDCGLLPALRPPHSPQGRPWGRIPYLSPEQAAGEDVHPTSDVYVIGSLLYEMLTGRPPFRANDEMVLAIQHLRQEPPSLQILIPDVPPALVRIVQKSLAKEPAARYRNAGQFAHILRSQLGPQLLSQRPGSVVPLQAPARERLVVPAPPAPSSVAAQPAWRIHDLEEAEDWVEEADGVDWLMIALLIAALVAVLGLIPLWRTVHRRYTNLSAVSAAVLQSQVQDASHCPTLDIYDRGEQAEQSAQLGPAGLIWYNYLLERGISVRQVSEDRAVANWLWKKSERITGLGVEITGFRGKA